MERVWRGFAKEFSGKEVRYDDFVSKSTQGTQNPLHAINPSLQKCLDDAVGSILPEKPRDNTERPARLQLLQKKIAAYRRHQHAFAEAQKDKEAQLVQVWEGELELRRKKAEEERNKRKQLTLAPPRSNTFLTSLPDVVTACGSSRAIDVASRQIEPKPPAIVRRGTLSSAKSISRASNTRRLIFHDSTPGSPQSKSPTHPSQSRQRARRSASESPKAKLDLRVKKSARLGNRLHNVQKESHAADDGTVHAEAIFKRYPGLAGSSEGRAIKDKALTNNGRNDPSASLMPNKVLVRRAQAQLLNKLNHQLVHYRQQIKGHFKKILEAVEVQYTGGRPVNLARADLPVKS